VAATESFLRLGCVSDGPGGLVLVTDSARLLWAVRFLAFRAGGEIRIPPKVVHTFKAETDSDYTVEFRPALRIEEFLRDLFALPTDRRGNPRIGDAARLMRAYPDEFLYFPFVPVAVQRALAVPLSKLGSVPTMRDPAAL
jgi:hypothetical protein